MTFTVCEDDRVIKAILTVPVLYRGLHDDFEGSAEKWEPVHSELLKYVTIHDGEELLGIAIIGMHSRIQYEIHAGLLPHVGWKRRVAAARELFEWLWANGPCQRIIGKVIASNRYTLKFNQFIGMEVFGKNSKAFMRDGRLQDEVWFGLSRPEGK